MKYFVRIFFAACLVSLNATAQTNFWQQTNGPYGGMVYALAINSSGHVFAGTDSGVFRSTDEGATWTHSGLSRVRSLVICSNGSVFACNRLAGPAADTIRVYRTDDEGLTWTVVLPYVPAPWSLSVGVLATNPQNHIFAAEHYFDIMPGASYSRILRSTDNGQTWSIISGGGFGLLFGFAIDPMGLLFRSGYMAVSRSSDNGQTWVRADSGINAEIIGAFAFNSQNQIFVGADDGADARVYSSTNHGDFWTIYDTLPARISAMIFTPPNDDMFVGTYGAGTYRNGSPLNSGLTDSNIVSFAISPLGYLFTRSQSGVVFRSVQSTVGVEEIGIETPTSFRLEQNYPNPFNPVTVIRYSLPVTSFVTLRVYNVLSQEVATLANEEMKLGNYEVTWDATGFSSGVYFYRLQAGQFVETKKLILLR